MILDGIPGSPVTTGTTFLINVSWTVWRVYFFMTVQLPYTIMKLLTLYKRISDFGTVSLHSHLYTFGPYQDIYSLTLALGVPVRIIGSFWLKTIYYECFLSFWFFVIFKFFFVNLYFLFTFSYQFSIFFFIILHFLIRRWF